MISQQIDKLNDIDKEDFDKVMRMVEYCGDQEKHFNSLETEYRKLTSTWLLAALAACGFVLKVDTTMPFDKWYLVCGICVAASIGIAVLWIMDLKVYHKLLHSIFLEGMQLELDYHKWLRPIRINMARSQKTRDVTSKVQYYYFISIALLLVLSIISVWNLPQLGNVVRIQLSVLVLLTLLIVWIRVSGIIKVKKQNDVTEMKNHRELSVDYIISEYEKLNSNKMN